LSLCYQVDSIEPQNKKNAHPANSYYHAIITDAISISISLFSSPLFLHFTLYTDTLTSDNK
jgi:hypothetical protein